MLEIILSFIISLCVVLLLDSVITLLLNLKSEKKQKYLKTFLILLSIFLVSLISYIIYFKINYNEYYSFFSEIFIKLINFSLGLMLVYGIILSLYSGFLQITKKPDALKTLVRGIILLILPFVIVLLESFIYIDYF